MPRNPPPGEPYDWLYEWPLGKRWVFHNYISGRNSFHNRGMSTCPGGMTGEEIEWAVNMARVGKSGARYPLGDQRNYWEGLTWVPVDSMDEIILSNGNWEWSQTGLRCTSSEGLVLTEQDFTFQRKSFAFFTGPAYIDLANWVEIVFDWVDEDNYQSVKFSAETETNTNNLAYGWPSYGKDIQIPWTVIEFSRTISGSKEVYSTRRVISVLATGSVTRGYPPFIKGQYLPGTTLYGEDLAQQVGVYCTYTNQGFWRITASIGKIDSYDYAFGPTEPPLRDGLSGTNDRPRYSMYGYSISSLSGGHSAENGWKVFEIVDYFSTGKKAGVRVGGTGVFTPSENHYNYSMHPSWIGRDYSESIKSIECMSMRRGFFSVNEENKILCYRISKGQAEWYTAALDIDINGPNAQIDTYTQNAQKTDYDPHLSAKEFGYAEQISPCIQPGTEPDSIQLEITGGVADHEETSGHWITDFFGVRYYVLDGPSETMCSYCNDFNGSTFILKRQEYSRSESGRFILAPQAFLSAVVGGLGSNGGISYSVFHGDSESVEIPCNNIQRPSRLDSPFPENIYMGFAGIHLMLGTFNEWVYEEGVPFPGGVNRTGARGGVVIAFIGRERRFVTRYAPSLTIVSEYEVPVKDIITGRLLCRDGLRYDNGYIDGAGYNDIDQNGNILQQVAVSFPVSDRSDPDDIYVAETLSDGSAPADAFTHRKVAAYFLNGYRTWNSATDSIGNRIKVNTARKICNFDNMEFIITPLPVPIPLADPHPAQDEEHDYE